MGKTIHAGHREHMRERFLENGLDGFQPHEMLEMLLYYGIPRVNTNEIAHNLLDRCGSLGDVMRASPETLMSVEGMTRNAVIMIEFLRDFWGQIAKREMRNMELNSAAAMRDYFRQIYRYETQELVYAAFLDDKLRVHSCIRIAAGHLTMSDVPVRRIAECAFREQCNTVTLAHNHPGSDTVEPSPEDIAVTRYLVTALQPLCIQIADHVIVAQKETVSLREIGVFTGL